MEDTELLELFRARSGTAIAGAGKKYGPYCRAIAYRILESREDSEECFNDTLLRAWDSIPPAAPENLGTYLGRITRNLALDRLRSRDALKRGGGSVMEAMEELAGCLPDSPDPEGTVMDQIVVRDTLHAFLGTIKADERIVFVKRYWYLESIREIARDMGCTQGRVKMSLMRTRNALKQQLQKEGINV